MNLHNSSKRDQQAACVNSRDTSFIIKRTSKFLELVIHIVFVYMFPCSSELIVYILMYSRTTLYNKMSRLLVGDSTAVSGRNCFAPTIYIELFLMKD